MGHEFLGKPNIVSLDVMVKPFRPHPKTVGKISAPQLSVVNPASKPTIRQASPSRVSGTASQITPIYRKASRCPVRISGRDGRIDRPLNHRGRSRWRLFFVLKFLRELPIADSTTVGIFMDVPLRVGWLFRILRKRIARLQQVVTLDAIPCP